MKKQHTFIAYILIGFGVYFLIKQLNLSIFENFYGWPTFLIIVGAAFLIHAYSHHEDSNILPGFILFGLGVHFHGLQNYPNWFDHWSMYPLIIGVGFMLRYLKTKRGLLPGAILLSIALFMIVSMKLPEQVSFIYRIVQFFETFWPVVLIGIGVYLLVFRRK